MKNISGHSFFRAFPLIFMFAVVCPTLMFFASCKKEDGNYILEGKVSNGNTGESISGVNVKILKQTVSDGTFGGSFSTAANASTDASGMYQLKWARENFSALRVVAEKNQFITRTINLTVDNFSPGESVTQNINIFPEAFVAVSIQNTGESSIQDELEFTFTNAFFDCACCANGWKTFSGADLDTVFDCKVYGDRWLKHQRHIITADLDTVISDSIYCPAFQTTQIEIEY